MRKRIRIIFAFLCIIAGISYGQSNAGVWVIERTEDGCVITGYNGSDTDVIIPSKWGGLTVLGIGDAPLQNKKLTSVTIPSSVRTIGSYAFANIPCLNAFFYNLNR